jgi:lipopolysaccharide export system protein LptA
MRAWILMLCTVITLFGAFVLYTRIAAPPARPITSDIAAPSPSSTAPASAAPGEPSAAGAWVNLYDKNARFYGRLRSAACIPTPDHLYHLIDPQAQFFQPDGHIVDLVATDGDVAMSGQASRLATSSTPMEAPSRGTLRNVTMRLYAGQAAADRNDPDLTAHLPTAQFDSDTYQISTADLVDPVTGHIMPAERIPVSVLGRDMDIYGQGLMLYWDGAAHDLKSLLLKHGDHLILKNTTDLNAKPSAQTSPPRREQPAGPAAQPAPASSTQPAVAAAAAPTDPSRRYYQAVFAENVRVTQGEKQPIQSDQMEVTLAQRSESPATQPAIAPPPPTIAKTDAVVKSDSPKQPVATAPPAPANQPVIVYWTGPLNVKPVEVAGDVIPPGHEIVRFLGSPHIHQDNLDAVGQRVRYDSATGAAHMAGAPNKPMVLTLLKPDGKTAGVVWADLVDITRSPAGDLITFTGPGKANFANADKPDEVMRAAWEKGCDLTVLTANEQSYVHRAVLRGNAFVSDGPTIGKDKLHLTAQQIAADFDPPLPGAAKTKNAASAQSTSVGPMRQMVATGNAVCIVHDDKEADRMLSSDQLTIQTATDSAGKQYPKFVTAEGNVYASQDVQDLRSRRLDATLAQIPATAGSPSKTVLQNLLASGNVIAHGKNGESVESDTLAIQQQGEQQNVTVLGSPRAVVAGQNGTLRGAHIDARPKDNWAKVVGAGDIDGTTLPQPGKPPQPMHVEWTDSAELVGDAVDVHGGVVAHSREASGRINDATADNAHLDLVPKSAAAGVKKKTDNDPMGGKQVKLVRLLDHAAVTSTLAAPNGAIISRLFISGNEIDADNSQQRMTVPGPGRMLLEDHPVSAQPKKTAASSDQASDSRGTNGFWWSNQFVFDQLNHQAVIDGSVIIKHIPDAPADSKSPKAESTTVQADHVVADFEKDSSKPSPSSSDMGDQMKLKQLTATGHVQIKTAEETINATTVVDDPVTGLLIASGSPNERVRVINDKDRVNAYFKEVWIDTRTNMIQKMIDFTGARN